MPFSLDRKTDQFRQLLSSSLDLVLPKYCVHCRKLGHYLCPDCYQQITFLKKHPCPVCNRPAIDGLTHPGCLTPWAINGITCATKYRGPIRSLVRQLKYPPPSQQVFEEIELILQRYFTNQETYLPETSLLTPIPLHPSKRRNRGFNQAALISKTLAELWDRPRQEKILLRHKRGQDQVRLPRAKRLTNVRQLYSLNPSQKDLVRNRTIVLIDDVVTTGATLRYCAQILKRNGAQEVYGIAFARD